MHWLLLLYLYGSCGGIRIGNRIRIHIRICIRIRIRMCALSSASSSLVSYQHIRFSCASFATLLLESLEGIALYLIKVNWPCDKEIRPRVSWEIVAALITLLVV